MSAIYRQFQKVDTVRDLFYKRNETRFFKDRHWIDREFEDILSQEGTVGFEVGCGVGNLLFPALARNPTLFMHACDFSSRAVELVKLHPQYDQKRCNVFEADILQGGNLDSVRSVDVVSLVFVLSALVPSQLLPTLVNIRKVCKKGALVMFRDYAIDDEAEMRFKRSKEVCKLGDHLYVRSDRTTSLFFSETKIQGVMAQAGLQQVQLDRVYRAVENRRQGRVIDRVFLQGVWQVRE